MLAPWKKSYDQPRQNIKKQRRHLASKSPYSQSCGLSSSHVWMWELEYKESWVLKNWCFWTVVLEETLESGLDSKKIQSVKPKGNKSWIFIGRTEAEAEAPILWLPDENQRLLLNEKRQPGFLASGGEEFNLGPETRLDRSEFCVIKFY